MTNQRQASLGLWVRLFLWGVIGSVLWGTSAYAALSYDTNASNAQMAATIDGPGLTLSNLAVTHGVAGQFGVFAGGSSTIGVESGLFMDTGNVGTWLAPNNNAAYSAVTKVIYGDPDLASISSGAKYDPAIIEFDIVPQGNKLNFLFSFGSEEYPEYVCSRFNDAFGLFVSGPGLNGTQNAAFMPNTRDAIAVNNVNGGAAGVKADGTACNLGNTAYFIDNGNGTGSGSTQLDGYTKPITASLPGLIAGQTYHVKLALADAGDPGYDSGAAFKWLTSTQSTPVDLSLTASANKGNPVYNSEVELTFTLNNATATATNWVNVALDWPAGLAWVSDDSGGAYNPTTHEWNADALAANGMKQLKIRARVGTDASYSVTGEITYAFNDDPDSTPFNHLTYPNEDDTAYVTVNPVANSAPQLDSFVALERPENQTAVATVSANDANGDALNYAISGGTDADKFSIDGQTGQLSFVTAPDYEKPNDTDTNNVYQVILTVSDGTLTATQTVQVTVTDVMENVAPDITSNGGGATAAISLPENKIAATTVVASDANNDVLTYQISGGVDKDLFQLNSKTGKLTFMSAPDYETPTDADKNNVYVVQVTVSDGTLTAAQTLRITITDVAENIAPDITSDGGNDAAFLNMPENQAAVTTVVATDANHDPLTYQLGSDADETLFQINTNTGTLAFINPPDYETPLDGNKDNIYIVTVIANDGVAQTKQVLFITVTDVFENLPPVITSYAGVEQAAVSLDENIAAVGTITATDGNHDTLTYSLVDGQDSAQFSIDAQTGVLAFVQAPDYEKPKDTDANNTYVVTVQVSDGSLSATQTLSVTINDVADVPTVNVMLKVMLQGAYRTDTKLMTDTLNTLHYIPRLQPYGDLKTAFGYATTDDIASPFDYLGTETATDSVMNATGHDAPVDWVLVELRDPNTPTKRIAAAAGILQRDGEVVDAATGKSILPILYAHDGTYYIMIRHRNHVAVMTKTPLLVSQDNPVTVDFSALSTLVYGDSKARLEGTDLALMWSGDVNNSNTAIATGPGSDSSIILGAVLVAPENKQVNAAYRLEGYYATDLNMDGVTLYTGPSNDANYLIGNILIHPANVTGSMNFILRGSAPVR